MQWQLKFEQSLAAAKCAVIKQAGAPYSTGITGLVYTHVCTTPAYASQPQRSDARARERVILRCLCIGSDRAVQRDLTGDRGRTCPSDSGCCSGPIGSGGMLDGDTGEAISKA